MIDAEYVIRRATSSELPTIHSLAHAIWPICYASIISNEQIEYMLERMYLLEQLGADFAGGIRFDLLHESDVPIGFAAYGPAMGGESKLHKLYLRPTYHGRGLGSYLLGHVITATRELGVSVLTLNVNKNNTRALNLYRRHGFEVRESVQVDIGGGFIMDDYIMSLTL